MSTAETVPTTPDAICAQLHEQTLQACRVARIAAGIVAEGIATGVPSLLDGVREREKELDTLDRVIDQGVTAIITQVSEAQARELLACLKFIIDLERVGDLPVSYTHLDVYKRQGITPRFDLLYLTL